MIYLIVLNVDVLIINFSQHILYKSTEPNFALSKGTTICTEIGIVNSSYQYIVIPYLKYSYVVD